MYDRARDYCLRAFETRHPGIGARLRTDAKNALQSATPDDVPVLFWLAASWGASLATADSPLFRIAELVPVRLLLARALELNEAWEAGAIHEALIVVDGLPRLAGGSPDRARKHFDRAVELSDGQSAFAFVTMASSVSAPARNRAEFESLLKRALAIDVNKRPALRLANLVAEKRARFLLSRAGAMFR
jgi:predicted anti-sigma-YlaC factor YlaD